MITDISEVREGKLCWPDHKPRAAQRTKGAFHTGLDVALREIKAEMERWRPLDYVISRNNQRIFAGDPGVALWWVPRKKVNDGPNLRVLACDKYLEMGSNAHAIGLTLNAMRALERWGAYSAEQAAEGARIALPPPVGAADLKWRLVLGDIPPGIDKTDAVTLINGRYRRLAAEAGDNQQELLRLNLAVEAARAEFK